MKKFNLNLLILSVALSLVFAACRKDEDFNVGWTDSLVETEISLDPTDESDITIATLNPADIVREYMDLNQPTAKWYEIDELIALSGNVFTTDLLPITDLEDVGVYVVANGEERLIGSYRELEGEGTGFALEGTDLDIAEFAADESVDIVLRPRYKAEPTLSQLNVSIGFTGRYTVSGAK